MRTIFTHKNYLLDTDCGYMPKEYAGQNNVLLMFLLVCDCLSRVIVCKVIKATCGVVISQALSDKLL